VALRAVTGEIAASIQDTMSWMLAAPGGAIRKENQSGKWHTIKREYGTITAAALLPSLAGWPVFSFDRRVFRSCFFLM